MRTRSLFLAGLLLLAVFYTLYFTRPVIVPVTIAVLLNFLCSPAVRWLKRRFGVPYRAGATLVIVVLLSGLGVTVYNLAAPAAEWVAKGPESLRQVERKLRRIRGSVAQVERTAAKVEQMAAGSDPTTTVKVKSTSLGSAVLGGTQALLFGTAVVFTLLFFLLADGDQFTAKLVKVLPQAQDKRLALTIAQETERSVSTYLGAVTFANILLGIVTAVSMSLVGLPNPVLWGLVGGLLNYVPYIGGMVACGVLALAGLATFDSLGRALLPAGIYLVLTNVESVVTPYLVGNRLTLNPVVVFVSVLFWGWLWGVAGALLAIPIMATVKIICDHVQSLSAVGEFLGR